MLKRIKMDHTQDSKNERMNDWISSAYNFTYINPDGICDMRTLL